MLIKNVNYLIISPVRNEEKYIGKTIQSVLSQTVKPKKWIIVNDGSTDNTSDIVKEYSSKHDWMELMEKSNRGYAEPGRGVIEAFYFGYDKINIDNYDYVVKLDGDLEFQSNYFESIFLEFNKNDRLGIASGICLIHKNDKLVQEKHPEFHTRGPSKIYRKECWKDIGGLVKHIGWDFIDEMKAQFLGWETKSFQNLHLIHFKPTGYNTGVFKQTVMLGKANYYCGYHPLFIIAKSIKRMAEPPYMIGGIGLLYGFLYNYINKYDRMKDKKLIKFIRREQIRKLTFRKSIWD